MISARGVSKRFGPRLALRSVDLQVERGQLVALLGPNGAGKSTLLRILASLARPTLGEVTIAGSRLPEQAAAARERLGFVGHQTFLYGDLSAEENLAFFTRLYRVGRPSQRISELLKAFELYTRRNEPVRSFSRGMQQRLSLARALVHRPRVLLLDEPHSGLDRESVGILDDLLKRQIRQGVAILMATHDLQRAARLAQRVDVLANGRLLASWGSSKLRSAAFPGQYDRALRASQSEVTFG